MVSPGRNLVWLSLMALLCGCTAARPVVPLSPTSTPSASTGGLVHVRMQPQQPVEPGVKSAAFATPQSVAKHSAAVAPQRTVSALGDGYLYINALDYSKAAPSSRVFLFADVLKLAPASGNSLDAVAHCSFDISLATAPDPCTLSLDWSDAPPAANTFVGLSNWSKGTWEWFKADPDGVITLPGWADYVNSDSRLMVSLLVTGTQRGLLRGVRLGESEERGTGVDPAADPPVDDSEPGEDSSGPVPPLYAEPMPVAVDLSAECGPVRDQGPWQSCTAFAFGDGAYSMILSDLYGRLGWDINSPAFALSPKYLYVTSGQRSGCPDSPDFVRGGGQVAESLKLDGIALEQDAPYDYAYDTDWSSSASEDAKRLRIDTYEQVQCYWNEGRKAIKTVLYQAHRPLVFAIDIDQAFCGYEPGSVYTYIGPAVGAHEMCIVGYDDARQAYKVRNSWGTSWGMDGYAWVSYETFDKSSSNPSCYLIDDTYDSSIVQRFLPFGAGIAAPANFIASNGGSPDEVMLTWHAVDGASGYRIYRDSEHNLIADTDATSFVDTTALLGYAHLYWVSAYDSSTESANSSVNIGYRQVAQDQ